MNSVVFMEDKRKVKNFSIKIIIIGAVLLVLGILLNSLGHNSFNTLSYTNAALSGCLIGAGIALLVMAVMMLSRGGKPPLTVVSADENGVMFSSGQVIRFGEPASNVIRWEDILSFSPAQKGIQRGVGIMLKDPAKYKGSLTKKENNIAKQNERFLGSPAAFITNHCEAEKEEIAARLNELLKSHQ